MTCSARRSLDQGQTEPFGCAYHDNRMRISIQLAELLIADIAGVDRSRRPFEILLPEHGAAPTDDNQGMSATLGSTEAPVRLRQPREVLAGVHTAHGEKVTVSREVHPLQCIVL